VTEYISFLLDHFYHFLPVEAYYFVELQTLVKLGMRVQFVMLEH